MKMFKIATAVQLLYCLGCLVAVSCLSLYGAFYPAAFTAIAWKIGLFLTFLSVLNPMGLIGSVVNCIQYGSSSMKKSQKALAWVIAAPMIITMLWLLAFSFLCYYTSGV